MVIGAVVLVAGVIAIVVTQFGNTAKPENTAPTGPPIAPPAKAQANIPFPKAAWRVTANEFLFTALPRKHLAESYAISHPEMRAGFTLKQWEWAETARDPYFPTAKVYTIQLEEHDLRVIRVTCSRRDALVPKRGRAERDLRSDRRDEDRTRDAGPLGGQLFLAARRPAGAYFKSRAKSPS